MPVWHALATAWREQHDLAVVGLVQEQHPDRAELFARWQGFDWPLLWDPFNLSGAQVVPNVYLLDEAGTLIAAGPRPEEVAALLERPAPSGAPGRPSRPSGPLVVQARDAQDPAERATWEALSRLLHDPRPATADVQALVDHATAHPDDPAARFRAGVALRLHHDAGAPRPGDFQAALEAWSAALAARPDQYIWRRRIQQYGPTLDKPYPFYPWVAEARADLAARGESVPPLQALLTEAERAAPGAAPAAGPDTLPEPPAWQRDLPEDATGVVGVETAVAFATRGERPVARVHLVLRPDRLRAVHWDDEPGAPTARFSAPESWTLDRRQASLAPVDDPTGPRRLELEVALPPGARGHLEIRLAYSACEGADGVCASYARTLRVPLEAP